VILKPQDIMVLVKIEAMGVQPWTFASLAPLVMLSASTIHEGLGTAARAGLYDPERRLPIRRNLLEFLVHGVKYSFPPSKGSIVRGDPTSYAASPLVSLFPQGSEPPPVWPLADGAVRGISFEPLYPSAPLAARKDLLFREYLVLIDAIRDGRSRERNAAVDELTKRLQAH
jgi:hypothetical protein